MNTMKRVLLANRLLCIVLLTGVCLGLPMLVSAQDTTKEQLFQFAQEWKQTAGDTPLDSDLNQDTVVDALDLLLLLHSLGDPTLPTPTPTIVDATPTITPTPTPTIVDATPTITPTPTPTIADATPTATAVPPSQTPTPTVTPSVTPTPTPTLIAGFEEFCADFDQVSTLEEAGFVTLNGDTISEEDLAALVAQGRHTEFNTLDPWFLYDETDLPPFTTSVASSGTNSIGFNQGFTYFNLQTSIISIEQAFFTEGAITPRLRFDIAYNLEQIGPFDLQANDYLVVEVLRSGADNWELVDLNSDGTVINDPSQLGDGTALSEDSFDAFFGSQRDFSGEDLESSDFITVEVNLPKDPALQIAFRFVSDNVLSEQGAFIDTLCVYDAGAVSGDPVLNAATPLDADAVYADSDTRLTLDGANLSPVGSVVLNVEGSEQSVSFVDSFSGVTAVIPRFADVTSDVTASLRVIRTDGAESNLVNVVIVPAVAPEVTAVQPSFFPLLGGDTTLTITGNNFRPAFEGASEDQGSTVTISQLGTEVTYDDPLDFVSRSLNEIVIDARALQESGFSAGELQVVVSNGFSGLESEPFVFSLVEALDVNIFDIQVGGFGGVLFDPATENFPLQSDHTFELIWEGSGFSQEALSILINDATFVIDNAVAEAYQPANPVDSATVSVFIGQPGFGQRVILSLSPGVLPPGEQTVVIQNGAGGPLFQSTFTILEPLAPILYGPNPDLDTFEDWGTLTLSADANSSQIVVVGDNFRGLSNEATVPETDSQVFMVPTDGGDPILLDDTLLSLFPTFTGNDFDRDIIDVFIPAGVVEVPEGETRTFRIQVLNPDSGLSVTSAEDRVLTFTP